MRYMVVPYFDYYPKLEFRIMTEEEEEESFYQQSDDDYLEDPQEERKLRREMLKRNKEDCEEQEERYAREKYGEDDIDDYVEEDPDIEEIEKNEVFSPQTLSKDHLKLTILHEDFLYTCQFEEFSEEAIYTLRRIYRKLFYETFEI
jgi:hypothetical protein